MGLIARNIWRLLIALDAPRRLQRLLDSNTKIPEFANTPIDLKMNRPFKVTNAKNIIMGDHIRLGEGSLLHPLSRYPGTWMNDAADESSQQHFNPTLRIGNGVVSTSRLQIAVHAEVDIADNVMFASNVFLSDALHGYMSADIPYKDQPLFKIAPIKIGQGCWIGQNVVIMPGVDIGEQTIIGANSVVTCSIPARSIAVGAPARVIKTWSSISNSWCAK